MCSLYTLFRCDIIDQNRKVDSLFRILVLLLTLLKASAAYTQDGGVSPPMEYTTMVGGKYSGTFQGARGSRRWALTVEFESIQGGVVRGTMVNSGTDCIGRFPLTGTVHAEAMVLSAPGIAGCKKTFNFAIQDGGRALVGKMIDEDGLVRDLNLKK